MQEQITYKVATMMFKCINNIALAYLSEMVTSQLPHTRSLRSTNRGLLYTTKSRTEFVHSGFFKSMGPHIWNNVPANIKNSNNIDIFKTRLKDTFIQNITSINQSCFFILILLIYIHNLY